MDQDQSNQFSPWIVGSHTIAGVQLHDQGRIAQVAVHVADRQRVHEHGLRGPIVQPHGVALVTDRDAGANLTPSRIHAQQLWHSGRQSRQAHVTSSRRRRMARDYVDRRPVRHFRYRADPGRLLPVR